jgi:hypothetical protein
LLAAAATLLGCPDTQERLDEFENRIPDAKVVVVYDAAVVNEIPDITGTALLSIRVAFASVNVQTRVDWTLTKVGEGGSIDMTLRFLHAQNRTVVGDPLTINDVVVDNTASFTTDPVTVAIPVEANPLGNAVSAENLVLTGTIRTADLTCGSVSGVVQPVNVPLTGSTFGAVRATPGATGNDLPAPVVACPQ